MERGGTHKETPPLLLGCLGAVLAAPGLASLQPGCGAEGGSPQTTPSPGGGCPARSAPRGGDGGERPARPARSQGSGAAAFLSLLLLSGGDSAAPGKARERETELSPWSHLVLRDPSLPKGNAYTFIMCKMLLHFIFFFPVLCIFFSSFPDKVCALPLISTDLGKSGGGRELATLEWCLLPQKCLPCDCLFKRVSIAYNRQSL